MCARRQEQGRERASNSAAEFADVIASVGIDEAIRIVQAALTNGTAARVVDRRAASVPGQVDGLVGTIRKHLLGSVAARLSHQQKRAHARSRHEGDDEDDGTTRRVPTSYRSPSRRRTPVAHEDRLV